MLKLFLILLASMAITTAPALAQGLGDLGGDKAPTLNVKVLDQKENTAQKAISVESEVQNFDLADPHEVNEIVKEGQGHIHYRLDDGPVIATTAKRLSFHEVKPGTHTLTVNLAGNDHKQVGTEQKLSVEVK